MTAPIDVHLMVSPVDRIVGDFIDAGLLRAFLALLLPTTAHAIADADSIRAHTYALLTPSEHTHTHC